MPHTVSPESVARFVAIIGGESSTPPPSPSDFFRWYDASGINRVYSDDRITPAVDDDPIYSIEDIYDPSENPLAESTLASRPLWKAGVQNGLHMARFDGIDDVLSAACEGRDFALVIGLAFRIHATAPVTGGAYFSWADALTSGTPFILVKDDGAGNQIDIYVDGGYQFTDISVTPGQMIVMVLSYQETAPDAGDWKLLVNGVSQGTYSGSIGAFLALAENLYIMNGFGGYQNGDFGEIILSTAGDTPSAVDGMADVISAYLMYEWGVL